MKDPDLRDVHALALVVAFGSVLSTAVQPALAPATCAAAAAALLLALVTERELRRRPHPTPVVLEQVLVTTECGLEVHAVRDRSGPWPKTHIHVRRILTAYAGGGA